MNRTNKTQHKAKTNSRHSRNGNYFLKRTFIKKSTGIILFLHIIIAVLFISLVEKGPFGKQGIEIKEGHGSYYKLINPKINSINDFFSTVFPNLIVFPAFIGTGVFSPISGIFWWQFDDTGEETQTDGTDLFFLSTEIPTNRKRIFWGKVVFLTGFFLISYLILFALPLTVCLGKSDYFSNFTGLHTLLFLGGNFLITPLFFFVPLVIFLFSLASLKSVGYTILKGFGRLSAIFFFLLGFLVIQSLLYGGEIGKKIIEYGEEFFQGLSRNYLLTTLTIMGVVIFLALFTLSLAYKDFQEKDLN